MFELRLSETNTIIKAGTLSMCQAIQSRNNIKEVSFILPIQEQKTKRTVKLISVVISLIVTTIIFI